MDERLLTQLAYNARGDICPMQGVIGGITAQEVMKVCSALYVNVEKNNQKTRLFEYLKACIVICFNCFAFF